MNIIPKVLYFLYHQIKDIIKSSNFNADQDVIYKTQNRGPIRAKIIMSSNGMATITWTERRDNYSIRKTEIVSVSDLTIVDKKDV